MENVNCIVDVAASWVGEGRELDRDDPFATPAPGPRIQVTNLSPSAI